MPFETPTIALLRDTFRRAIREALERCEETHASYLCGALSPSGKRPVDPKAGQTCRPSRRLKRTF